MVTRSHRTRESVCRVALVGAGRMGQVTSLKKHNKDHDGDVFVQIRAEIMSRNPRIQLVCIIDVRLSVAAELSQRLGGNIASAAHLTNEIVANVDAVWICVGTSEHLEIIRMCQDKVVVAVEKPVSLNRNEIDEAFRLNPHLRVCFQRFYDPHFCWLIDGANSLGPKSFLGANGDHPCPPASLLASLGSVFHDLAIHGWFFFFHKKKVSGVLSD
jgi:hypothetical protein